MRKREVVKIDEKEFTIKELTIKDIIELVQNSTFLSGGIANPKEEKPSEDIQTIIKDLEKVMKYSCDFSTDDIYPLAPSEVRILYDKFKEVNSDFLSTLKVLGVAEALENLRDAAINNFSKTLAISLNQGI